MSKARDIADSNLDDLTVDTDTLVVDSTNDRIGIGTSSPASRLDIVDGGTYSGVRVSNTTNNSTNKVGHYTGRHYTNAEENVLGLRVSSTAGANEVVVGGGSGLLNAATSIQFYTAANATTLSGTERMRIDSSGNVGIGTSSPDSLVHLAANTGAKITLESTDVAIATNEVIGEIDFYSNDASGIGATSRGSISLIAQDAAGAGSMLFKTSNASTASTERMRIDSNGNVGINTVPTRLTSNAHTLNIKADVTSKGGVLLLESSDESLRSYFYPASAGTQLGTLTNHDLLLMTNSTERMRIDSSGKALFNSPSWGVSNGVELTENGVGVFIATSRNPLAVQRLSTDGDLVRFYTGTIQQGTISVSGTTVSYNGGHLARWSQLAGNTKDEAIVKGTVMTNLDQMAVWSHDAIEAQDAVYDEDNNVVTEAVEAKDAYTEDNEQLNCMAVSSVEGDPNVAGVFVNWDNDDEQFNDMNIAMTGDMVIRIAQGTTVARGDLLMSAGDGTAKPQGDDIVRSKTIAKVTSINVSHTYDDGSYLVPCVLMAC